MANFRSCAYQAVLLWVIQPSLAVVSDYCQPRLNSSNCGKTPMEVFTYWKPGSRCEADWWSGCPSLNMFASEEECKHVCIKHDTLSVQWSDNNHRNQSEFCKERLDGDVQCGGKDGSSTGMRRFVYTYNKYIDDCVVAVWYGCPSRNQFSNIHECRASCMPDDYSKELDEESYQDILCALAALEGNSICGSDENKESNPDAETEPGDQPDTAKPGDEPDYPTEYDQPDSHSEHEDQPDSDTEPGNQPDSNTEPVTEVEALTETNEDNKVTRRHKIIQ